MTLPVGRISVVSINYAFNKHAKEMTKERTKKRTTLVKVPSRGKYLSTAIVKINYYSRKISTSSSTVAKFTNTAELVSKQRQKLLGPDPNIAYPLKDYKGLLFLKNSIQAKNIFIGDYTYFDDARNGPENFEKYNVLYHYDFSKVKLVIGKFCAIAAETRFLMGGDHKLDAISGYPFPVFGQGWEHVYDPFASSSKGDIIVGNDVWFGYNSLIKNGVTIGHGAIVAAKAVVVKDVPAYAVVAGNPAKVVKMRFDDPTIERLIQIAWWDWDIQKITKYLPLICSLDVDRLEAVSLEK